MQEYEKQFHAVKFLTPVENLILECLCKAADLFEELCDKDPQNPTDGYNFGHYIDAAKNAVIMRGARRMDPDTLLNHHHHMETFKDSFNEHEYDKIIETIKGMVPVDPSEK